MMQFILVSLFFLKLCYNLLLLDARSVFSSTGVPPFQFNWRYIEVNMWAYLPVLISKTYNLCSISFDQILIFR